MRLTIPFLPFFEGFWIPVRDGNVAARTLFNRHYSKYWYKDGRRPKLFVGPGEKLVLLTQDGKALCVWRKFISKDGQEGINNAIFRNEKAYNGKIKSSVLLIEAEKLALVRWPTAKRFYTYVKPSAIRSSNPGCCYKKAGWKKCGLTKTKSHIIFEKI